MWRAGSGKSVPMRASRIFSSICVVMNLFQLDRLAIGWYSEPGAPGMFNGPGNGRVDNGVQSGRQDDGVVVSLSARAGNGPLPESGQGVVIGIETPSLHWDTSLAAIMSSRLRRSLSRAYCSTSTVSAANPTVKGLSDNAPHRR